MQEKRNLKAAQLVREIWKELVVSPPIRYQKIYLILFLQLLIIVAVLIISTGGNKMNSKLVDAIIEELQNNPSMLEFTDEALAVDYISSIEELESLLKYIRAGHKFNFIIENMERDYAHSMIKVYFRY